MLTFLATAYFVSAVVMGQVTLPPGMKPLNKDNAVYHDCGQLQRAGHNESGPYLLHMDKTPFLIRCEFTEGNALNVVQRRINGLVSFTQTLETYMKGFGDVNGDYWAGLNVMNQLTMKEGISVLTVKMQDWNNTEKYARYSTFKVTGFPSLYTLTVDGFSGTVEEDAFKLHNNMRFQTRDLITPCTEKQKTGWWYNKDILPCANVLLNGHYYKGGYYTPPGKYYDGIYWFHWGKDKSYEYSLKQVSMALSSS